MAKKKNKSVSEESMKEAFMSVRANIQLQYPEARIIAFTSFKSQSGTTKVAVETAQALASAGEHVVVVEADMRVSGLGTYMGKENTGKGLADYIEGKASYSEIKNKINENVDVIYAGVAKESARPYLGSSKMEEVLSQLREDYDYVCVDTPSLELCSDGVEVASMCDGTIVVVGYKKVPMEIAKKGTEQLHRSGCQVLGTVMNKVPVV